MKIARAENQRDAASKIYENVGGQIFESSRGEMGPRSVKIRKVKYLLMRTDAKRGVNKKYIRGKNIRAHLPNFNTENLHSPFVRSFIRSFVRSVGIYSVYQLLGTRTDGPVVDYLNKCALVNDVGNVASSHEPRLH